MSDFIARLTQRPIPRSCTNEEIWNDIPGKIGQSMGGREWFFETEARAIHRIGIGAGLGWRLPRYVQRPDGIDYARVQLNRKSGLLDMEFLHCGDRPPEEGESIVLLVGLQYADLRRMYDITMERGQ